MDPKLKTTVIKKTPKSIHLEIQKKDFEAFCAAAGLYRKEFLGLLEQSEKDHKEGRVTKRASLAELRCIGHHNQIYNYDIFK
jgi:hypothetical protein